MENKRKSLSLSKKLDLFEEFIKEQGNEIEWGTEYKGYPIGIMLAQIRCKLNKVNAGEVNTKYKDEEIERLRSLGLLEDKQENLDAKIERIGKFIAKYPVLWTNRRKFIEDYEALILMDNKKDAIEKIKGKFDLIGIDTEEDIVALYEQLQNILIAYGYIKERKCSKKLSKEQVKKIKDTGIGGGFGFTTEVDEIIKKYNINPEDMKIVLKKFGNIDRFRKKYIESMLNGDKLGESFLCEGLPLISCFDVSSPDFIYKYEGYCAMYADATDLHAIQFRVEDSQVISDEIKKIIPKLTSRQKEVVESYYDLNNTGKKETKEEIAKKLGITRVRVSQIIDCVSEKIRKQIGKSEIKIESVNVNQNTRREFIETFFVNHDIFYNNEIELNTEIADTIEEILARENQKKEEATKKKIMQLSQGHSIRRQELRGEAKYAMLDEIFSGLFLCELGIKFATNVTLREWIHRSDSFDISEAEKIEVERKVKLAVEALDRFVEENIEVENRNIAEPNNGKIEELNLSTRSYNVLINNGIRTIKDLISLTEEEVKSFENLGKGSYQDIVEKLAAHGYILETESKVNSYEIEVGMYTLSYNPEHMLELVQEAMGVNYIPIERMGLPSRAYLGLKRSGINTLLEICNCTEEELMSISYIGAKTYEEIKDKVHLFGGMLANEVPKEEKTSNIVIESQNEVIVNGIDKQKKLDEALNFSIQDLLDAYEELNERLSELRTLQEKLQEKLEQVDKSERDTYENELNNEINELEEIKVEIEKKARETYGLEL